MEKYGPLPSTNEDIWSNMLFDILANKDNIRFTYKYGFIVFPHTSTLPLSL